MTPTHAPTVTLLHGAQMPRLGFGTSPMDDARAERRVADAIEVGYRLIDTAENYGNERGVGRGHQGLRRAARRAVRHDQVQQALARRRSGRRRRASAAPTGSALDYIDLLLIHWPNPEQDRYVAGLGGAGATAGGRPGRARSARRTSSPRTCTGSSTRPASCRTSTRSSSTRLLTRESRARLPRRPGHRDRVVVAARRPRRRRAA